MRREKYQGRLGQIGIQGQSKNNQLQTVINLRKLLTKMPGATHPFIDNRYLISKAIHIVSSLAKFDIQAKKKDISAWLVSYLFI